MTTPRKWAFLWLAWGFYGGFTSSGTKGVVEMCTGLVCSTVWIAAEWVSNGGRSAPPFPRRWRLRVFTGDGTVDHGTVVFERTYWTRWAATREAVDRNDPALDRYIVERIR